MKSLKFFMRYFLVVIIPILYLNIAYAKKHKQTWDYPIYFYNKFEVKGSQNADEFIFDLRKDPNVLKEFQNNEETGIIGYLLYENGKIVIDEADIPSISPIGNNVIINKMLPSHSIGKSLVSYVTGHAICEGYIESVNEKLTGWKTVENTLFENQFLIDLLNMQAGDDKYVGERLRPARDNILKKFPDVNVNTIPLKFVMKKYFQNSKRDIPSFNAKKPKYNYSALTTNVIMNYVIYKTGDNWEKLLHKIFNEHIKVKGNVRFLQTTNRHNTGEYRSATKIIESGRYSFYATRYDYLRIAKAMLDDWHKNTCPGKYLKMLYQQRIKKNDGIREPDDVGLYTESYGGQFHFDIYGLTGRKIIGMSGFAGQQILIDIDEKRILVVNSKYKNYDWEKIVYDKIKN